MPVPPEMMDQGGMQPPAAAMPMRRPMPELAGGQAALQQLMAQRQGAAPAPPPRQPPMIGTGLQRPPQAGAAGGPGGPRGPFGGRVAMQGQGGFQALPKPAMAGGPTTAPAERPAPSRAGLGAPSAYGPVVGGGASPQQRIAMGRLAQQVLGRGR